MAGLTRVIKMGGVDRTLALDFNATIALADSTGKEFFELLQSMQEPAPLTPEEIKAWEATRTPEQIASNAKPPEPKGVPIGKKMLVMRRLIWAMSATEHPEFIEHPETAHEVGSWFDISEMPAIAAAIGEITGEYAVKMSKSNGGGKEFEGQLAPFVPTPTPVVEAAINAAGVGPDDVFYDFGAGDGRVMLRAAEAGAGEVIGWEKHPERYIKLVNRFAEHALKGKLHFRNSDFRETTTELLSIADVVFVYLLPKSNEDIKDWLFDSMRPGARIVSHDFIFEGKTPSKHLSVRDEDGKLHQVYVYTIPEVSASE